MLKMLMRAWHQSAKYQYILKAQGVEKYKGNSTPAWKAAQEV